MAALGSGIIKRGLLAGAAGTTVLNAITYGDMVVRGRPSSDTPERTVDTFLREIGRGLPGSSAQRGSRRTALGALSGIASGLGIGVAASVVRSLGVRLPAPFGWVATGAGAMLATNLPMALAGISDPRDWSATDWVSDALPHLGYGIAAHAVIAAQDLPADAGAPRPPTTGVLLRSFALGTATGMRSSLGVAGPALFGRHPGRSRARFVMSALPLAGELAADKHPRTPSRLRTPGLVGRLVSGAGGARTLARHPGERTSLRPVLVGVAGAAAGTYGGAAWRRWAGGRMPDWRGAVIEDGVGLGLAFVACRGR